MALNPKFLSGKNKSLLAPNSTKAYNEDIRTTVNSIYESENRMTMPGKEVAIADPTPKSLSLTVTNLIDVSSTIGDATSLGDWNDFFQCDIYANTNFTSINVEGTEIQLFGATNLSIRAALFSPGKNGYDWIVSIDDQAGSITDISDIVFCSCVNLTELNLPGIKRFGFETFNNCSSLSTITAPSLLEIGYYTFDNCDGLVNVSFPECLHVDQNAFTSCNSLESVDLPKVISIGNDAFYSCTSLNSIYTPNLLTIAGEDIYNYNVFTNIVGNTIAFTLPQRLMTCNYGDPQPDVQYLIDNNTVTITAV